MDEAAIIGAGPVGLALAILLVQEGRAVRVFEQRTAPVEHSRAIGLHPPAQQILEQLGVGAKAQHAGVQIRGGLGISRGRSIAAMDFSVIGGAYRHVLSLPQQCTEQLLRERLEDLAPGSVERGCAFERVLSQSQQTVEFAAGGVVHRARWLAGADGVRSAVRTDLGVRFAGKNHHGCYLMGDFPDTTSLAHTAALFLHPHGIVESFPMPGRLRRWVVRFEKNPKDTSPELLAETVGQRSGYLLNASSCTMSSLFGTATRLVPSMVHGRVLLLGDAAHQISPIGGQGLSLGFQDAQAVAQLVIGGGPLQAIDDLRLRAARSAARRAQVNMLLGRALPGWAVPPRDAVFSRLAASAWLHQWVARDFTMTGLRRR
ncbi:FAD-dependent oxidoreductase [Glutamicibacter arilaitensis]|uniref:Aromatic-ring hydroxylase n=1 Tax=Glutamicibacter arilaitensis (strain DSM 16368 / CIP 108037 / IAM 15318 / JCM 13566 / NCIMB 14258 / Re117) TaxID=861360 RepID=A0ABN0VLH8_GLUAR|nr:MULTISPECIES: NAD(P)/FAD-dependent oxidoreductase [Glutamicibacter]CBT77267.1 putative aromatic-ring hydroxylase [Glutamicibacter arilaitensis Re117]